MIQYSADPCYELERWENTDKGEIKPKLED